jgi:hypothetical protein
MPTFSLDPGPRLVTQPLRSKIDAPLPLHLREVRGFGSGLEPRYIVRARPLDQ